MNRRGFTLVELMIVVAIMTILLVLGVVNLRDSQVNARDAERKTDIETIALHLETYYKDGTTGSNALGYPPTALTTSPTTYLVDLDPNSITAPTAPGSSSPPTPATTFIAATNNSTTTSTVTPQPTINTYVYQPLQDDPSNSLCTVGNECRRFYLYYRLEADNTVYQYASKNQ